jgi:hypothetical protein
MKELALAILIAWIAPASALLGVLEIILYIYGH